MEQPHQVWTSLSLTDGQDVIVDARTYPILMEWDWDYESESAQAVRSDGSGVRLYDEQIRLLAHAPVSMYPVLDRAAIRALFSGLPGFDLLLQISQLQREPVVYEVGVFTPPMTQFLAHALSAVLADYHRWATLPRVEFQEDAEGILPGAFVPAGEDRPHYLTLADWLQFEYTGRWMADKSSPCGLIPEPKYADALKLVTKEWRRSLRATNAHGVRPREVEQLLDGTDVSIQALVHQAIEVIGHYRV